MGSTSCPGPGALVRRSMVSASCPRRLKRCSTGLQGRPPEPGDSRIGPRSHGVYQLSHSTPSRFPGPSVFTSSRGRIILGSDGPWGCPELRGDSRPCPRACGVDQMSRETFARVKVLRGRPAVPPESGPGPRSRGVDQLSRVNQASVRMRAVSTTFPGDSGSCRRVRVVDQTFGRLRPMPEGPRFRPASRANLDCARCRCVEQHSQGTRTWTEGTRGRPAVPGDISPGLKDRGVDQHSLATRACVRVPEVSTSCPGPLALAS